MVFDVLDDDTLESIRETLDSAQTTLDSVSDSVNKIGWPLALAFESVRDALDKFNSTEEPKIGAFLDGLPKISSDVDQVLSTFNKVEQPKIDKILDSVPPVISDVGDVIKKFNTSEQPKIDKILDSVPPVVNNVDDVVQRFNKIEQPKIENTLDDLHNSISRFHTEEQPRVEKLMDSANHTVQETTTVLKSVDQSVLELKLLIAGINKNVAKIQDGLNFVTKYKLPILIVIGFTTLVWVAISVMVLYILIKIAFGPVKL